MKRNVYLVLLVRRTAVLLACGLPALAAASTAAPLVMLQARLVTITRNTLVVFTASRARCETTRAGQEGEVGLSSGNVCIRHERVR